MDIKTLSALSTLVILTGCAANGVWTHPTKTQAQFHQDKFDCQIEGDQYASNLGMDGNPMVVGGHARDCMAVKGYTWTKTSAAPPAAKAKPRTDDDDRL